MDRPTYRRRKEVACKLTTFSEALELALKADSHRTKQSRRTAKALITHIKADGHTGGYSRVADFVRALRDTEGKAPKTAGGCGVLAAMPDRNGNVFLGPSLGA